MQSRWKTESELTEPRYSVDAVRRATRVAAELERYRSETLSVPEIEALARELEIDPECMRRALATVEPVPPVSRAWIPEAPVTGQTGDAQAACRQARQERGGVTPTIRERLLWGAAAAAAGLLIPALWLGAAPRRVAHASPVITPSSGATHTVAGTLPAGSLLLNGDFSVGPKTTALLSTETESLRGWQVMQGNVTYLPSASGARGGSVCLEKGGCLRQLFRTQPYATYRLSLDLSGRQAPHAVLHRLVVAVEGDTAASAAHFTEAGGQGAPGWTRFTMEFQAREPGTTVEIRGAGDLDGDGGAPIVDNVAVTPIVSP